MTTKTMRSGPFWDGVEGRAPMPRAAKTLGLQFISADVDKGTIELAFDATEAFTNPAGNVLGAFLAAMLYDTVGPALLATLESLEASLRDAGGATIATATATARVIPLAGAASAV
jgi:acyl-coenzyme A thioesterase PaaI-like protein